MTQIIPALLVLALVSTVPVTASQAQQPAPKAAASAAAPVNLNSASASQLEALPGVGASMALRIIEYREKNGGFKKVEDLMNIRGIGEKNFLRLKPMVTVAQPRAERAAQ